MRVKIIEAEGIYFGEDYFQDGEVVDVVSFEHDGECQVATVFSNKEKCNIKIYETEFDSIEFLKEGESK